MMNQSFTKQYSDAFDRSHPSGSDHVFHGVGNGITPNTTEEEVPSWALGGDSFPSRTVDSPAHSGQVPSEPIQFNEKAGSMLVTSIIQQPALGARVSPLSRCYEAVCISLCYPKS